MSILFTPFDIGSLSLGNRLIRSATWEGVADEAGFVTDKHLDLYRKLAEGGVGLIISGYLYIRPEGKGLPGQLGIYRDGQIAGLTRITEAVHQAGGLIMAQIAHAGGQTNFKTTGTDELIAPSELEYPSHKVVPRAIELDEIPELIADFGDAARRAMDAGFDGVQLHGAHGYLINRFLSPASNRREDEYGGSIENRARFGADVIRYIRSDLDENVPLSIKLNVKDFEDGGLEPEDAAVAAKLFSEAGVDHIEVSGGTPAAGKLGASRPGIKERSDEAYFREFLPAVRKAVEIPVGLVGGIRSFDLAEEIVEKGEADSISLARPLISEPDLPNKWKEGSHESARCISCGACFVKGLKGGIDCATFEKEAAGSDPKV